jgi:hypothetical protein
MKPWLRFLWIPLLALAAGCEDSDWKQKDASGFSKNERFDAAQSGTVLPGMTPKEVQRLWGRPHRKQATGEGEEWIYYASGGSGGYDVHTSVKFAQGKVTDVVNGDLMQSRLKEPFPDLAPDVRPGAGATSSGSPGFSVPTGASF